MLDIEVLLFAELFELHAVQEALVHAVGNTAAEGRGVVVLFDFPDRHWIDRTGEGAIDPARKGANRSAVSGNCGKLSRIVIARHTFGIPLDQHIDDTGEIGWGFFLALLLIQRERTL